MAGKLNQSLKILFLPAWYPGKDKTVDGIFIREHARSAALYNKIVVLYIEKIPLDIHSGSSGFISEAVEAGIRTIRIYYRESRIPGFNYPRRLILVYRAMARLIKEGWKPDIIHAHVYTAGFIAVLMKVIFNIPVIVSEHSSEIDRAPMLQINQNGKRVPNQGVVRFTVQPGHKTYATAILFAGRIKNQIIAFAPHRKNYLSIFYYYSKKISYPDLTQKAFSTTVKL